MRRLLTRGGGAPSHKRAPPSLLLPSLCPLPFLVPLLLLLFSSLLLAPPALLAQAAEDGDSGCGPAAFALLVDGSAAVDSSSLQAEIALALAVAAPLLAPPQDSLAAMLEYSAFPCAASSQCTPWLAGADELADRAASIASSYGAVSRLGLALTHAAANVPPPPPAALRGVLVVTASPVFEPQTLRDAAGALAAAGTRLRVLAVGAAAAASLRAALNATAEAPEVAEVESFAVLASQQASLASLLAAELLAAIPPACQKGGLWGVGGAGGQGGERRTRRDARGEPEESRAEKLDLLFCNAANLMRSTFFVHSPHHHRKHKHLCHC